MHRLGERQMAGRSAKGPLLRSALNYGGRGWHVFPCRERAKEPLTKHGFRDATTNVAIIQDWWEKWPDANIGIATGAISGFWVIDIDHDEINQVFGHEVFASLVERFGPIPATIEQNTPTGGKHILFRHVDRQVRNSVNRLGRGLDTRGDGGYIVAAPSIHPRGGLYSWSEEYGPDETELSEAPRWLIELAAPSGPGRSRDAERQFGSHHR